MSKKMTKRILAILGVLVVMAVCVTPAFAYNATVTGGTITFKSYLYTTRSFLFSGPSPSQVPNVTIAYQVDPLSGTNGVIVAGTKNADGTLKSPTVYATANNTDRVQGSATASSVTFGSADAWTSTNDSNPFGTASSDQFYCEKTITLNFSGVTFKRPGIYRFRLTPTSNASSAPGVTIDSTPRYVDVYVNQNTASTTNKDLVVSEYVIHKDAATIPDVGSNHSDKDTGFENAYRTSYVVVQKNVAGNQGDKETEFDFTINVTGANPNMPYDVMVMDYNDAIENMEALRELYNLTAEEAAELKEGLRITSASNAEELAFYAYALPIYGAMAAGESTCHTVKANSRTGLTTYTDTASGLTCTGYRLTTNASGNATYNFKLADGDCAVICNLPATAQYSVTEAEQDYAPAWAVYGNSATPTSGSTNTVTSRTVGNDDNGVLFTNTREVPVATGIETAVIPFALLAAFGLGAIAVIIIKKTRKEKGAC